MAKIFSEGVVKTAAGAVLAELSLETIEGALAKTINLGTYGGPIVDVALGALVLFPSIPGFRAVQVGYAAVAFAKAVTGIMEVMGVQTP
jgi:hypothetical protein